MSDEDQTVPETVTADTPDGTGTQQQEDYEQRYKDAQAWGTKQSQEASQLRDWRQSIETDPDAQREFLRGLGYDVEDDTPVEPPTDFEQLKQQLREELMQEIEPVKQTQAQQAQEKELAAAEAHAAKVFTDLGVDESEQDAVIGLALTMPAEDDGMPPFKQAYERLTEIWDARQAKAATRRRPTHTFSPSGVAGDEKPDLTTHEGRVANAMAKLADTA